MTVEQAAAAHPPITAYDPYSPEVMDNPEPYYAWLREHHPLYYMPQYDMFAISRFDDLWEVMGDTTLPLNAREGSVVTAEQVSLKNVDGAPTEPLDELGPFFKIDSPVQGELRSLVNRPLRAGQVPKQEEWFRSMVRTQLQPALARGAFNLPELFGHWSSAMMCHLAGLEEEHADHLHEAVNARSLMSGNPALATSLGVQDAGNSLYPLALQAVERRREALASGAEARCPFVDTGLTEGFKGRSLTDAQVANQIYVPLVGGVETVPKVTSHCLWELEKDPDQLADVRADLENRAAQAFEEAARFCGPAQWFARVVTQECEILGQPMKPGQRVAFLVASASQDPEEYGDPEVFRWNRDIDRSLAFGRGDHFCMGIHLARMEGRVILQEFLSAVEDFSFDETTTARTVSSFQKGRDELTVRIHRYRDLDGNVHEPFPSAAEQHRHRTALRSCHVIHRPRPLGSLRRQWNLRRRRSCRLRARRRRPARGRGQQPGR